MNDMTIPNAATKEMSASMQGWTDSPSGRGTYDIIWSCFTTTFLALYTMLHINVKAPDDGFLTVTLRKTRWLVLAILAPELLMLMAGGQWASAKRSVEEMDNSKWTIRHAFYADSGGFVIEIGGTRHPVTAKQVYYLVKNDHIPLPEISNDEIWDKSKADRMAKALMGVQTAWFVINCISRAATGLPVTPLELATTALVSCSAATYFFWWHKPLNVASSTIIAKMGMTAAREIQIAGMKEAGITDLESNDEISPFEFAEPGVFISRSWHTSISNVIYKAGLQRRILARIPNDRDPRLHSLPLHVVCGIFTALFASLHFFDWHFMFPTYLELLCYRISCCTMEIVGFLYGVVEVIGCYIERFEHTGLNTLGGYKKRWPACLLFVVPAGLYLMSRVLLIVLVLASLRSLPVDSYKGVDWGFLQYLPHI